MTVAVQCHVSLHVLIGSENHTRGKGVRYKSRLQFVKNGGRRFLVLPKNYVAGDGFLNPNYK